MKKGTVQDNEPIDNKINLTIGREGQVSQHPTQLKLSLCRQHCKFRAISPRNVYEIDLKLLLPDRQ